MKQRIIPNIKSHYNSSTKINFTSNNSKNKVIKSIKLPLAKTSHSKYLSSSNITNPSHPSNKQNLSTNYSIMNTLNNINTTTNKLTTNTRKPLYHSPKNKYDPNKIYYNILNTANNIIKQRQNDKIFMYSLQRNSKKEVINAIKEISLKNYHIELLKKKRIDIDEKETYIHQSLLQSSHKLEKDYENFLNIVDNLKIEQKKDEEKLGKISNIYEATLKEYNNEINYNKKLNSNIIKVIKLISNYKRYGIFFHKIFGLTFPYEDIEELDNRLKISEDIREKVIKVYQKDEKIDYELFGNVEALMRKFDAYEEKLIKHLLNKEKAIKEYKNMIVDNIREIMILKQKRRMFKEDLDDAMFKKKKLIEFMANILNLNKKEEPDINNLYNMQYVDENLKACKEYIKDIGKCLEIPERKEDDILIKKGNINSNNDLQDIREYIDYTQDIIKCLEEKEKLVNEYTTKINEIIKDGNNKDRDIILNLLAKMKRDNKFKKIINVRNKREELSNVRRLNEMKRSQKNVIYQKRVLIDLPIKSKINKTDKVNHKEKNDYEYLYYSSEDSEDNENNENPKPSGKKPKLDLQLKNLLKI